METKNPQAQAAQDEKAALDQIKKVNKKTIITICVVVAIIAFIVLGIVFYNINASKKADEAIAIADLEMNDSIALDSYMKAAQLGHKSGNRAKLNVAMALYDKGEYQKAIDYLNDASVKSEIVEAGRLSLLGDCYVNLDQNDKAISCYDKAISAADGNPQLIPFLLVKKAHIYEAEGKHGEEYKMYKEIFEKYPEYATRLQFDIRKYEERAKAQSEN